jgi:hypothetical protein
MGAVSEAKITDDFQDNVSEVTTDRRFKTVSKELFPSLIWREVACTATLWNKAPRRLCYHPDQHTFANKTFFMSWY